MSQFGGSKNPPWSSLGTGNTGGHHQVMQSSLMGLGPSPAGLYNQQMAASASNNTLAMQAQMQMQQAALQPQAPMMPMQQMGGASANSALNVTYPTTGGRQSQGNQPKQRVFMGTITKLHDTFGFIDEDVFFQTSTVKGSMPKVGEKVLVEATFNPNMPFKWNATRVQHLNQATSGSLAAQQMGAVNQMGNTGMMNAGSMMGMGMHNQGQGLLGNPPQAALNSMANRRNEDRRRLDRDREREQRERERMRDQQERDARDRKRERENREREKERDKERERSPVKKRSRSPRRSPKRVRKPIPRYVVQVPRFSLDIKCTNVLDVKKRYPNLYIPSDYFMSDCCYQDAFPLGRPFNTSHPCSFHLMGKDVDPVAKHSAVLEPPDISYQYSAKVMLLASVSELEYFKNCCARIEDPSEVRENFQHPARILSFLVGSRGKNEVMAIGGPWSPSLDGADPANDKSVLIRTAIRTTKALTGIDLSGCGKWYRFLEIRYHRAEQKGRPKPRVETVVMFVPDVWNIMPTRAEWETLSASYKDLFTAKYVDPPLKKGDAAAGDSTNQQDPDASMEEDDEEGDSKEKVCTPWRELDPKTMKVQALRDELDGRGLNAKGLKTQLVARLAKAIKKEEEDETAAEEEQEAEEAEAAEKAAAEKLLAASEEAKTEETTKEDEEEAAKKTAEEEEAERKRKEAEQKELEEKKKREEKERQQWEKKYTLPAEPGIVVHPSATAKGGKFECTVMNLSVLLDYRPEDTKEHSFEVSLFAELFNELLQRDFAFNIYQALLKAPEKKEEKKEKKKEDKKDDKKKDEKKDTKKDDKKDDKKDEKKEAKAKDEEKKEGDKEEEKEEDKKETKKEEEEDEPKEKKRKVEEKSEEQPKGEETSDDAKDEKEDGKEKKADSPAAAEEGKKDEKKKDDKGTKTAAKRSSSQEDVPKPKIETLDPMLLLSCVYFDQNHCGYLMEKDLEDLLNCLGLNLSRAQIRKLMHKVVSRDSWVYRKVTDGVRDEAAATKEAINGTTQVEVHKGNLTLMESLQKTNKPKAGSGSVVSESGLVTFEGAVVDLASTMSLVKRSEEQRRLAESKIAQLQKETDKWKNLASNSQESSKALHLDVEGLKKKLQESEGALGATKRKNEQFRGCVDRASKSMEEMSGQFKALLEKVEEKKKAATSPIKKEEVKKEEGDT